MTYYRQTLWVEDVPVVTTCDQTQFRLLLDEVRMFPRLITSLEEGESWDMYAEMALSLSRRTTLGPAHQLFWRTRVTPELVPRTRLMILLPKLTLYPPPIPDKKTLLCSSKRLS